MMPGLPQRRLFVLTLALGLGLVLRSLPAARATAPQPASGSGSAFPDISAPPHDPATATRGLIGRLLGAEWPDKFGYETIAADPSGHDVFEVESVAGRVTFRGNTGVAMSSAFGHYLKYYCHCSMSWGLNGTGDQLDMPSPLPDVQPKVRQAALTRYRYYFNVCTVSYSAAWWSWERWQRELDWMALHGINMPLSFTGQEYVWYKFYSSLGLTDTEIEDFFSGPAFLAWFRMGNIQKWAGPLTASWQQQQRDLQLQILDRARSFGMTSALPGFAGHVPGALKRVFPNASLTQNAGWARFNTTYSSDYLLEPTDPLFQTLGEKFYKLLIAEFGTDHVFQMDTYNEMEPSSKDPAFLKASNVAVYNAMRTVDPEAVYLMQGWLFHEGFWGQPEIDAYLAGIPDNGMMILDLNTEASPIFDKLGTKPWLWCMLHNYGGRRGLYGDVDHIASQPVVDKQKAGEQMIGMGITPEAIEQNPVMYDIMTDMFWRSAVVDDVPEWISDYAKRRYGANSSTNVEAAWTALHTGAYDQGGIDVSIIEGSPAIGAQESHNTNATAMVQAWTSLQAAFTSGEVDKTCGPCLYDLVDVGRQVLTNVFADIHSMHEIAYQEWQMKNINSTASVAPLGRALLSLISDLDRLLASNVNYLLGTWVADAVAWAHSPDQAAGLRFNALNQVTLWGPEGQISDYAAKMWAGLVGEYYLPRWSLLLNGLLESVRSGVHYDFSKYSSDLLALEQAFGKQDKVWPTQATGDTVAISAELLLKYTTTTAQYKKVDSADAPGNDITQAWTTDIQQLKLVCSLDPTCQGFNSNGWLKHALDPTSAPGSDLYVKL